MKKKTTLLLFGLSILFIILLTPLINASWYDNSYGEITETAHATSGTYSQTYMICQEILTKANTSIAINNLTIEDTANPPVRASIYERTSSTTGTLEHTATNYSGGTYFFESIGSNKTLKNNTFYWLCLYDDGGTWQWAEAFGNDNVSGAYIDWTCPYVYSLNGGSSFVRGCSYYEAIKSVGLIYDLGGGAPPPDYFSITCFDYYSFETINVCNATINGTSYYTTNGVITTNILNNASIDMDVKIESNESGGYFDRNYTWNVSSDRSGYVYQSIIKFVGVEAISNDTIMNFTLNSTPTGWTGNKKVTDGEVYIYYNATSFNVAVTSNNYEPSYQNMTHNLTVNALDSRTETITFYTGQLNITAQNYFTQNTIMNFTGWIYNADETWNQTFNTSTGSVLFNLIAGDYQIYAEANDYAISNETNYENVSFNASYDNTTFKLFTSNSIYIYIYDEDLGSPITSNITIVITGNESEDTHHTSNGTQYIDNLTDGEYSLKFSGTNYSLKTYVVTVAERSTQTLNAYLSQNYETVTFTILDSGTGTSIEGASFQMERMINSTWTVTDSKSSDITGRVQTNYIPNVQYKFTVSNTNYQTKVFYLNPVIFSSYNVKIDKDSGGTHSQDYSDVSIAYYPTSFWNDANTSFTFTINSPNGILETYTLNITYPTGGTYNNSGNNSIGESFTPIIYISEAETTDRINITYCYDTVQDSNKCFNREYEIIGALTGNQTFMNLQQNLYGMGLFERMFIVIIVVMVLAGFTLMITGIGGSLTVGLITMSVFSFIGFIPLWTILISLLVGFVIIITSGIGGKE